MPVLIGYFILITGPGVKCGLQFADLKIAEEEPTAT